MTNEQQIRLEREDETRAAFGIFAMLFGLAMLAASALGQWCHRGDTPTDLATLFFISSGSTILFTLVNLCRTRVLSGALVQAALAFATMLCTLILASARDVTAGVGAMSGLAGAILVAFGGISRINGEVVEEAAAIERVGTDRKWVYRNNQVVAVEEWVDGKRVSTTPVVPTIAR